MYQHFTLCTYTVPKPTPKVHCTYQQHSTLLHCLKLINWTRTVKESATCRSVNWRIERQAYLFSKLLSCLLQTIKDDAASHNVSGSDAEEERESRVDGGSDPDFGQVRYHSLHSALWIVNFEGKLPYSYLSPGPDSVYGLWHDVCVYYVTLC